MFLETVTSDPSANLPANIQTYITIGTVLAGTIFGMFQAKKGSKKLKAAQTAPKSIAQQPLRGVRQK